MATKKSSRKATKPTANRQLPHRLTVTDYNWGCAYEGTRQQLIKAGLLSPKTKMPKGNKEEKYVLPLNWVDGWNEHCYGPRRIKPRHWDASLMQECKNRNLYRVWVEYDVVTDLNIRERAEKALFALSQALSLAEKIAPRPLSLALPDQIRESKTYGKMKAVSHD